MVIIDGKFVYADYAKEDTFDSYLLEVMLQCIADISDFRTFTSNTGVLQEVKVQEVKKKVTLSQLYAERGVGVKFRFVNELSICAIRGHEDTFDGTRENIIIDFLEGDKVVGTANSCGSWYVETV